MISTSIQLNCYDIFVIKHTHKKFLEDEIEKIHLEGLVFSWWISLSVPRALNPLGPAGPDGTARPADLLKGQPASWLLCGMGVNSPAWV